MDRGSGKDVSGFRCETLYKVHPKGRVEIAQGVFFDTGDVIGDEGARFENMVAASLRFPFLYLFLR